MKKLTKTQAAAKALLLSTVTVRSLQAVDDRDLREVVGGGLPTCPRSCFCSSV